MRSRTQDILPSDLALICAMAPESDVSSKNANNITSFTLTYIHCDNSEILPALALVHVMIMFTNSKLSCKSHT